MSEAPDAALLITFWKDKFHFRFHKLLSDRLPGRGDIIFVWRKLRIVANGE